MTNKEMLSEIKEIRNEYDTLGLECGIASRFSMDTWAQMLQDGGKLERINFSKTILHKVSALRTLLYSIEVKARSIKDDVIGERAEENFELMEQEDAN